MVQLLLPVRKIGTRAQSDSPARLRNIRDSPIIISFSYPSPLSPSSSSSNISRISAGIGWTIHQVLYYTKMIVASTDGHAKMTPRTRDTQTPSKAVSARKRQIQNIDPSLRRPSQVTGYVATPSRQYSSSCGGVWCTLWAAGDSMMPISWRYVHHFGLLLFSWWAFGNPSAGVEKRLRVSRGVHREFIGNTRRAGLGGEIAVGGRAAGCVVVFITMKVNLPPRRNAWGFHLCSCCTTVDGD